MRDKLANFCWLVFSHWRKTSGVLLALLAAGLLSYSVLLPREGFPSIQFPLTIVNIASFGDDASHIDKKIAAPLQNGLTSDERVQSVQTFSRDSFLMGIVFFSQDTQPQAGTNKVKSVFDNLHLGNNVQAEFSSVEPAKYLNKYDALISIYAKEGQSIRENQKVAAVLATELKSDNEIKDAKTEPLLQAGVNPRTGQQIEQQTHFNHFGVREDGQLKFYPAVTVGVTKNSGTDVIDLSDYLNKRLDSLAGNPEFSGYGLGVSADFADQLKTDIASLERNMLSGIAVVVIVTLLLISLRASIVTAVFILSVILTTMLALLAIGYSLNTITLFALVLSLGLFVDDATIMVEAIDAEKHRLKLREQIIKAATKKVALASFAGTITTVLVFGPLVFIGGILGDFIRVMPVTVIIALFVSYILSLVLVPVMARFTVLRSGKEFPLNFVRLERRIAGWLESSIKRLKTSRKLGRAWGIGMVVISLLFLMAGGMLMSKVSFNIFPPSKDSNQLQLTASFVPGTTIKQAEQTADQFDTAIQRTISSHVRKVTYGGFDQPTDRSADAIIELTPYDKRDTSSIKLAEDLQTELSKLPQKYASVRVNQVDPGPPDVEFPFLVQVFGENPAESTAKAGQIASFLEGRELTKANGETAKVTKTKVNWTDNITRLDGRRAVQVEAAFDSDDISALVAAAKDAVQKQFPNDLDRLGFDFGQESENADSFSTLGIVFPIAVLLVLAVLIIQFRSIIQPLLIFLAIPFSLLGVALALVISNNPLSFFSVVGMIGLVGIAVNNTIMLTDYANQQRRAGKDLVDAIAIASRERFRPLVVTTLTTTGALLPLALVDPFWQSLAVVIIGGLLSSTLLVIFAFPYYYYYVTRFGLSVGNLAGKVFKR